MPKDDANKLLSASYLNVQKLSDTELLERLKRLYQFFKGIEQDSETKEQLDFTESAATLVQPAIIKHKKEEIRIYAALCISEIFRLFAPNCPYDNESLQTVFRLFISQICRLENPKTPHAELINSLLESLAVLRVFALIIDLQDLVSRTFEKFFAIIGPDHSRTTIVHLLDILLCCIDEADLIPQRALETVLLNLISEEKNAKLLAQHVLCGAEQRLKHPLSQLLERLITDVRATESDLHPKLHEIILEVYFVCPSLLTNVLPHLEGELRVEDVDVRRKTVFLLGKIFSSSPTAYRDYMTLFNSFLSRYKDIDPKIRAVLIEFTEHFVPKQTDPGIVASVLSMLKDRLRDLDENIRQNAVHAVFEIGKRSIEKLTPELIAEVELRLRDKKNTIRAEALNALSTLYTTALAKQIEEEDTTKKGKGSSKSKKSNIIIGSAKLHKALMDIPSKIIACYASLHEPDDRIRIEKAIHNDLLGQSSEDRANNLIRIVTQLDQRSFEAFQRILKEKVQFREHLQDYLNQVNEGQDSDKLQRSRKRLLSHLPQGIKLEKLEHIEAITRSLSTLANAQASEKQVKSASESLRKQYVAKKTKSGKLSALALAVSSILDKLSTTFVDKNGIKLIVGKLHEAVKDNDLSTMRLAQLLEGLSEACPALFATSLSELTELLQEGDEELVAHVLRILANVGNVIKEDSETASDIKAPLQDLALNGTPKQAKEAVLTISRSYADSKNILTKLVRDICTKLDINNVKDTLATHLAALQTINKVQPELVNKESRRIRNFVMGELFPLRLPKIAGTSISNECIAIIRGMKLLRVHFSQLGDKCEEAHVVDYLEELFKLIDNNSSHIDKVALRKEATKCFIKLVYSKRFESLVTVEQFQALARLTLDDEIEIRQCLTDAIFEGYKAASLHIKYLSILTLLANDPEKEIRDKAKRYLHLCMQLLRKYIREHPEPDKSKLKSIFPEYALLWLVHLLAHMPYFEKDSPKYIDTTRYLSTFIDIASHGIDNYVFMLQMLTDVKQTEDAQTPESNNIHLIAELGHKIILKKQTKAGLVRPNAADYGGIILLPPALFRVRMGQGNQEVLLPASQTYLPEDFRLPDLPTDVDRILNAPPSPPESSRKGKAKSAEEDESSHTSEGRSKGTGKKAAKRTAKKRPRSEEEESEKDASSEDESDEDEDEDKSESEEAQKSKPDKKPKRTSAAKATAAKATSAKSNTPTKSKGKSKPPPKKKQKTK